MKKIRVLIKALLIVIVLLVAVQAFKVAEALGKTPHDQKPFVRLQEFSGQRFLFAGDSTAVGTGSGDPAKTVAGYFAQDFPQASIEQLSANGRRLGELDALFDLKDRRYKLIVLQIGANDIMKFTPLTQGVKYMHSLVLKAKKHADHVVILHSGNIGLAPVFTWPFNWILTSRTKDYREVYQKIAREEGVLYVDLFRERQDDVFLKDVHTYYAADMLHPGAAGYRWWYERIRMTLKQAGVVL